MIGHADAAFDALTIVDRLTLPPEGVLEGEVHMVAYLAFLLSIYAGDDPNDWGYPFVSTRSASPFSDAIDGALDALRRVGLVIDRGLSLVSSPRAAAELVLWRPLPRNARREPLLRAAADSAAQLSLPTTVHGLSTEPQLLHARQLGGLRKLPDDLTLPRLREHFASVDNVIGGRLVSRDAPELDEDLLVRAVLWLEYLTDAQRHEGAA